MDQDELIECAVMLAQAKAGFVDKIHIPANCLDALCQHLMGMALEKTRSLADIKRIVKRSYCYRNLKDEEIMCAINYLACDMMDWKNDAYLQRSGMIPKRRQ